MIQRFGVLSWPDASPDWKNVDSWPDSNARERAWATFERLASLDPDSVDAQSDKFAWILWSSARRLDKRIAKIETDKDKADSDAWWAKWEEGPHEYRQVYSNSVRKEWDRRLGEAKIAKFAHDWGFRALGRDRPYTVPAGKNEAVFVRQDAWFAILPDGTMSRHALSAKQKTDLHLAGRDRDGIVGPILASAHVN
jgi:hypothetical protein